MQLLAILLWSLAVQLTDFNILFTTVSICKIFTIIFLPMFGHKIERRTDN